MKTRSFYTLLVVCLLSTTVSVQAQKFGINYQAVARALGGVVVSNKAINLRFTITAGENGAVLYEEKQSTTTNFYGQFSCQIGRGTADQGDFSAIPWVNQNQYLKVELMADDLTKNDYVVLGNNPFTAVPFSFYALNSPAGPQGPAGAAGPKGNTGATITVTGASINASGSLVLSFSDGSTTTTPTPVVGPAGLQGPAGPTGLTGSQGPAGIPGAPGAPGTPGVNGTSGTDGTNGTNGTNGANGVNGLSVTTAAVDGSGHLVLTLSDGSTISTSSSIIGPAGAAGANAPTVSGVAVNGSGQLMLTFSDASTLTTATSVIGPPGPAGHGGHDGTNAAAITGTSLDGSGDLILAFSDGTSVTTPQVVDANRIDSIYIGADSTLNAIHQNGYTYKSPKIITGVSKGIDSVYIHADTAIISHYLDGHTDTTGFRIAGADTLWKDSSGNIINNPNIPFIGINNAQPTAALDVNGSINIIDTTGLQIGHHNILRVNHLGNAATFYTGLFVGDSAGYTAIGNQDAINDVAVGSNAGHDNTALENVFVGVDAGKHNSTGNDNTFTGYSSGSSDPSGAFNSVFGAYAGQNTSANAGTPSQSNAFFGYRTGIAFQGSLNTLLGTSAGGSPSGSIGDSNTVVGENAGYNLDGSSNTIVGQKAGYSVSSNRNTVIGANAGAKLALNGDLNTFVGYAAGIKNTSGAQNVFIGSFAAPGNQGGYGNVAIGAGVAPTLSRSYLNVAIGPNADINESIKNNRVITSSVAIGNGAQVGDGSSVSIGTGTVTQGTHTIGLGAGSLSYGDYQIVIGDQATGGSGEANSDSSIIIGGHAYADASDNIAIGLGSKAQSDFATVLGRYGQGYGFNSVAIGDSALANGDYSTSVGSTSNAMDYLSTSLGYIANSSGDSSAAFGAWSNAMGLSAVGVGGHAFAQADHTTSIGGYAYTGNPYSIALGFRSLTLGTSAIAIGSQTNLNNANNNGGDGSIAIGTSSVADNTFSITLGTNTFNAGANSTAIGANTTVNGDNHIVFGDSHITGWGFGQEVTDPTHLIDVNGGGGNVYYMDNTGNWNISSDVNLKENFEQLNLDTVLEKISRLPISEWNYKIAPESKHVGPMAQDFFTAFHLGNDNKRISPVDPAGISLAAIKGLYNKLREDEARIRELQSALDKQQQQLTQIDALTRRLDDLEKKLATGNNR